MVIRRRKLGNIVRPLRRATTSVSNNGDKWDYESLHSRGVECILSPDDGSPDWKIPDIAVPEYLEEEDFGTAGVNMPSFVAGTQQNAKTAIFMWVTEEAFNQGLGPQTWSSPETKQLVRNIKELINRHTYGAVNLVGRNSDDPDLYLPRLGDLVLKRSDSSSGSCPEPCGCGGMTTVLRDKSRLRMATDYGGGSHLDYDFALYFVAGCPIGASPGNTAYCNGQGNGTYTGGSAMITWGGTNPADLVMWSGVPSWGWCNNGDGGSDGTDPNAFHPGVFLHEFAHLFGVRHPSGGHPSIPGGIGFCGYMDTYRNNDPNFSSPNIPLGDCWLEDNNSFINCLGQSGYPLIPGPGQCNNYPGQWECASSNSCHLQTNNVMNAYSAYRFPAREWGRKYWGDPKAESIAQIPIINKIETGWIGGGWPGGDENVAVWTPEDGEQVYELIPSDYPFPDYDIGDHTLAVRISHGGIGNTVPDAHFFLSYQYDTMSHYIPPLFGGDGSEGHVMLDWGWVPATVAAQTRHFPVMQMVPQTLPLADPYYTPYPDQWKYEMPNDVLPGFKIEFLSTRNFRDPENPTREPGVLWKKAIVRISPV